jgi:putative transposase
MPNHIHLLIQVGEGAHLPQIMQLVLQKFGRWFQRRTAYAGHVWQGRYKSPLVMKESYFLEVGRYIERNPLRAGLTSDLMRYPWSSYPHYAHGIVDQLVDEDPYYAQIGQTAERRQQAYRDFVRIPCRHEEILDRALLRLPASIAHPERRTPPWYKGGRLHLQRRTPPLVMEGRLTRVGGGA